MKNIFYIFGSLSAFTGVALGAFGAHSLKESLSAEMLAIFETGVRYQIYHSFALFIAGWAFQKYSHVSFSKAGWLFVSGIVLFSGSLYMLAANRYEYVRSGYACGWAGISRRMAISCCGILENKKLRIVKRIGSLGSGAF